MGTYAAQHHWKGAFQFTRKGCYAYLEVRKVCVNTHSFLDLSRRDAAASAKVSATQILHGPPITVPKTFLELGESP